MKMMYYFLVIFLINNHLIIIPAMSPGQRLNAIGHELAKGLEKADIERIKKLEKGLSHHLISDTMKGDIKEAYRLQKGLKHHHNQKNISRGHPSVIDHKTKAQEKHLVAHFEKILKKITIGQLNDQRHATRTLDDLNGLLQKASTYENASVLKDEMYQQLIDVFAQKSIDYFNLCERKFKHEFENYKMHSVGKKQIEQFSTSLDRYLIEYTRAYMMFFAALKGKLNGRMITQDGLFRPDISLILGADTLSELSQIKQEGDYSSIFNIEHNQSLKDLQPAIIIKSKQIYKNMDFVTMGPDGFIGHLRYFCIAYNEAFKRLEK